jgi:hypothetical protein
MLAAERRPDRLRVLPRLAANQLCCPVQETNPLGHAVRFVAGKPTPAVHDAVEGARRIACTQIVELVACTHRKTEEPSGCRVLAVPGVDQLVPASDNNPVERVVHLERKQAETPRGQIHRGEVPGALRAHDVGPDRNAAMMEGRGVRPAHRRTVSIDSASSGAVGQLDKEHARLSVICVLVPVEHK